MKILLIGPGKGADLLLCTPLLRALKKAHADCIIHLLCAKANQPFLEGNPLIERFHSWDAHSHEALRSEGFDTLIDLEVSTHSSTIAKLLQLPALKFDKKQGLMRLYTGLKINLLPDKHLAERFLETASSIGVQYDGGGLDFYIPREARIRQNDIPASHQLGFVALLIGGSKFTRRMPVEKWRLLCEAIQHPVILIGDSSDRSRGEAIAEGDGIKVYNACGKFSFHESADLVDRSRFVIGHDTSFIQVAAALGKEVIEIWGSTTARQGRSPFYSRALRQRENPVYMKEEVSLWCRPCTVEGRDACPLGHFKCMKQIDLQNLQKKVEGMLRQPPPPVVWPH